MPTPSIDHLRRAAKALKKAYDRGVPEALTRFRSLGRDPAVVRHADCLHVVAREQGYASWPALKLAHETAAMNRAERLRRLEIALHDGASHVVARLLALEPDLAHAHLGIELARLDVTAATARLDAEPTLATRVIGRRRPILHLAFSRWHREVADGPARSIVLAERLLELGADVNDGFPPPGDDAHRLSALYGALGHADNVPLAAWLLERGADPNDNESLYHATELGHHDGLKLLMRHGVETRRTNALFRMLDFDDLEGARLLLDYGADPNEAIGRSATDATSGRGSALHHAIRRGRNGRFLDLLLNAGVDPGGTFRGHTPFAHARITGNAAMAAALEAKGLRTPLRPDEALLAAVQDGDARAAQAVVDAYPRAVEALHPKDRLLHVDAATRPDTLDVLRLLHGLGFDFEATDEMGLTALHAAVWHGRAELVPFLLSLAPDLERKNAYGGTALGTAVHGSANCPADRAGDHEACVTLLLAAGARLPEDRADWEMGTAEVLALLDDHAG